MLINHRDLLFLLPYGLLKALSGHLPDASHPYPEAFVFGSADAYAEVVHETAAGARLIELPKAFSAVRGRDWSPFIGDPFCGSGYRSLLGTPAEKLGRCLVDTAVKALGLSAKWIAPIKPIPENTADGAQDGLLLVSDRHFWIQTTGGQKPGILEKKKAPIPFATNFFIPDGESQLKGRAAIRRSHYYKERTPDRANVLHIAIGKTAPLALTRGAIRGVVWERDTGIGNQRRFVQTITVHTLMTVDKHVPCSGDDQPIAACTPLKRRAVDRPR